MQFVGAHSAPDDVGDTPDQDREQVRQQSVNQNASHDLVVERISQHRDEDRGVGNLDDTDAAWGDLDDRRQASNAVQREPDEPAEANSSGRRRTRDRP